ncbi:hypothetical protein [Arabidopsis thaliana]|uniref:Uncharacterized protein F1O3.6 n=2 Tax=Arabidopsis thaliana TaxID=3702 RepID=Q9C7M5_ARATH|nr:hypothetical protein [Arabidopsis thaliana]
MNEVKSLTTAEGPTKLLNLQLKDLGDSLIDVALWGKLAEDVYSNIKSQPSGPVFSSWKFDEDFAISRHSSKLKIYNKSLYPFSTTRDSSVSRSFNCFGETPQELLDLGGRNYVFKIMVKHEAKHNQSSTYKMISLTDVLNVIQSFFESASTLNDIEQEIITVSGNSVGTSIGTTTQAEINFVDVDNLDNNEDNAYYISTPKPITKRFLATSKHVQQSSTKP